MTSPLFWQKGMVQHQQQKGHFKECHTLNGFWIKYKDKSLTTPQESTVKCLLKVTSKQSNTMKFRNTATAYNEQVFLWVLLKGWIWVTRGLVMLPDSPSLRVRTPSKSHTTPLSLTLLLAKWLFMNYRTILNILNANENPEIPDTREMTRFWKHAKAKKDVVRVNGLQIHLILKKDAILQNGKIAQLQKWPTLGLNFKEQKSQKISLNTNKR